MAVTRVTIDELPEQLVPEDTNYFAIQDSGVSKKMSVTSLKQITPDSVTAHLADAVAAHAATAISTTTSGTGVDGITVQAQLGQLFTTKVTNGGNVTAVRALTQAAYNALSPPDPTTLYFIT